MPLRTRLALYVSALWWGSLTALGFVVVPLLFMHLESPAAAGAMAAKLFTAQTWLGIGCGMLLLMALGKRDARVLEAHVSAAMKFVVAAFLLALLVEFGVAPRIVTARALGADLKLWHGLGSLMYAGQWICTGIVFWQLTSHVASDSSQPETGEAAAP